jgi:hypothetical protein
MLTTIGEFAAGDGLHPGDARTQMEAKGIDITSIDFGKSLKRCSTHTRRPNIVDVEAWMKSTSVITVKIYVE